MPEDVGIKFIKALSELGREDVAIAGGKGASLGEMTQAGFPVPPGFVILSTAFESITKGMDIDSILSKVSYTQTESIEAASKRIQAMILNEKIPISIEKEILSQFKKLNSKYVAVRSSATSEDSATSAWAGQLDSFLNTTEETLLENVKKCWASLFTVRAMSYRFEKELQQQKISVAVVVQKMVESDVSGIAFSAHPVTQDRNQLLIEAGYGLGEAIVSGKITPDSYVVLKKELKTLDKQFSVQEKAIVRSLSGGNEWQSIPKARGSLPKLSDTQISHLAETAIAIESHYGFPVDIEWAIEKGKLYIVQSRPITTLGKEAGTASPAYSKLFSRDFCLASVEAWVRGESTNPKEWTDLKQPFLPYIVTERSDDTVHFYYDLRGVEWVQDLLVKIAGADSNFLSKVEKTVLEKLEYIRPIYEEERVLTIAELKRFLMELEAGYPWFEAMWWYCQMDASKLAGLNIDNIQKVRALTDKLCNSSDTVIRKSLARIYTQLGELASSLTTAEIISGKLPGKSELERRDKGYFFANGRLFVNTFKSEVEKELGVHLESEIFDASVKMIKGEIAQKGIVRGIVKRVMGHKQINEIKEGEILVSPMTIPDFLPAMKKASAFVTDEGGVVCHAAIMARELKKPCIVGTKIATYVLKDGDLVEVDANKGVVRILRK